MVFPSDKKGGSPVVAAIILVAFVLTFGAVIINWGFNGGDAGGVNACNGVEFEAEGDNVCLVYEGENAYLNFAVDNTGDKKISGFDVWAIGSEGTKLISLSGLDIPPGSLFAYKENGALFEEEKYGTLKQVHLIPIAGEDIINVCQKKIVKVNAGVCRT